MEGFQRQGCVDALRKGIAHHFSGAQVLNDGQIEPALCGGNVGNIAHPGLIWLVERELSLQKVRCRRVTVSGVGGDFAGPASHRDDPGKPQLSVNPLAGTSKFRLEHGMEAVQSQGGTSGAAPPVSAEASDCSVPAHRVCGTPSRSSRCARPPRPRTPAPQGFPGDTAPGRSGISPLWFRQDADGFF